MRCLSALDGPGYGVCDDAAVFGFYQELRGCADYLEVAAIDVKEVGGRVNGAEVAVDIEGVEGGGAGEAL